MSGFNRLQGKSSSRVSSNSNLSDRPNGNLFQYFEAVKGLGESKTQSRVEVVQIQPQWRTQLSSLQKQMQHVKHFLKTKIPSQFSGVANSIANVRGQYFEYFTDLTKQINDMMRKKEEAIASIRDTVINLQSEHFQQKTKNDLFAKEVEERLESIVLEKKDVRSSMQGSMQGSMSINYAQDSFNNKLLTELYSQLEAVREKVEENTLAQHTLDLKFNDAAKHPLSKTTENTPEDRLRQLECAVQAIDIIVPKVDVLNNRHNQLREMMLQFQRNIKESKESNKQSNKDSYKYEREFSRETAFLEAIIDKKWDEKIKDGNVVRIRNVNEKESICLKETRDGSQHNTYMLDEQNYLLDWKGNYLLQEKDGNRNKIQIDRDLLFLLRVNGINIGNDY